ncbi:IS66 family insertion sequence element accessory protein TnpB [Paraburkholderia diazotrophica]|uniref:IS66 family insertion sequence element accessory protein TnpB n=1 Tax=Paraburkholderia diazotrophica TaxID=667676 RepID=UPI0031828BBC
MPAPAEAQLRDGALRPSHGAMRQLDDALKVYAHRDAADFRKRINGLAAIVKQSMKLHPFVRTVYVFSNQRHDRITVALLRVRLSPP